VSRNAAFHEVWGRTAFAGESAPVVELYGVGSLSATVCRGRIHGRTTGYGATYAFSLRPLSVFSARTGLIGKDGNGSTVRIAATADPVHGLRRQTLDSITRAAGKAAA
jgi:hypothetical protein